MSPRVRDTVWSVGLVLLALAVAFLVAVPAS